MTEKIKCFFGFHDWVFNIEGNRYGQRCGDRCQRCGLWHKDSTITEYRDHDGQ